MENVKLLSKNQWVEDYKKLSNSYRSDEKHLIQSFLADDYHLSKIYQTLLQKDVENEIKNFGTISKQLKYFINEAYSYLTGKNPSRSNNNEFRGKIKKIDDMILKTRRDFKSKFENLLLEEEQLEKELEEYESQFEQMFAESNEEKQRKIIELEKEKKEKEENDRKLDIIDEYISTVLTAPGIIYDDSNTITFSDIEAITKRFNNSDLNKIKEKIILIDEVLDKKLGGINLTWQQKEHEEFLKIKNAFNNKINSYEFLSALSNAIPYLPSSELKNHIKLYDKFSYILNVKRILLKRYKEIKQNIEDEEKKKAFERIKNQKSQKAPPVSSQESLRNKKLMVQQWKEQKEKENEEMMKEKMRQEKEQKEKEKARYLMKKEQNQGLIDEYRKKKEQENYIKMAQQSVQESINPIDIERIKEREEALIEKKKNAIRAKSSKNFKADENYARFRLKQTTKRSKMDNKIMQNTEGFKNKQRGKFNPKTDQKKDACTMANNLLGHMSRGVPLWRKGLV